MGTISSTGNLRICFFTQQYGHLWSGLGTYTTHLINYLADEGHEITVVCPEELNRQVHPKVHVLTVSKVKADPSHGGWFSLSFRFSKTLSKLLKKTSFDLIHFTDAREALFCPEVDIPVFGTVHDCYYADAPVNPLVFYRHYHDWIKRFFYYHIVRRLEPKAYRKLNGLIANSQYVRQSVIRNYELATEIIKVIYLGIPKKLKNEKTKPDNKKNGEFKILFVGANFQRKGLPSLIRALPQVLIKNPSVCLYVIGKDPNQESIRRLCRKLKVDQHVIFLGWRPHEEVLEHFEKADLFVMPSLIEGFGFVFMEAMAAGVPVIGGNVGGTLELIQDGVNGFLVKPSDPDELAHKISIITENQSLRKSFIDEGFETLRRLTIQKMARETVDYYSQILRQSRESAHA